MLQDECWLANYNEIMDFMKSNHRNPSKHYPEENLKHNWIHHNRKMMNKGAMKPERVVLFNKLLALAEKYKHVNQYA